MAGDASTLGAAAKKFKTSGATVAGMGEELRTALVQMEAAAPDKKEVQKRLVQEWLAQYDSEAHLLNEEMVETWMKNRGFFQSLGIDIDEYSDIFNNDDQEMLTRALARAQQMVTEKAGTSVTIKGTDRIQYDVDIPGLGYLPARLDAGDVGWVPVVRAVVSGAESAKQAEPKDLAGVTKAIDLQAKHLLENGFVRVVLTAYEEVATEEDEDEADGFWTISPSNYPGYYD